MKLLKEYKRPGNTLTQIHNIGKWYIYRRSDNEFYEVVKGVQYSNPLPNGEARPNGGFSYPSTSKWGNSGFSFRKLVNAQNKINELANAAPVLKQVI